MNFFVNLDFTSKTCVNSIPDIIHIQPMPIRTYLEQRQYIERSADLCKVGKKGQFNNVRRQCCIGSMAVYVCVPAHNILTAYSKR